MKVSLKIFIFTYCLMMLTTILAGFLFIDYEYKNSMEQARKSAIADNRMLYTYITLTDVSESSVKKFADRIAEENQSEIVVGVYADLQEEISFRYVEKIEDGQYQHTVVKEDGRTKIQVVSKYKEQYIVNYYDVTELLEKRNQNYQLYRNMIIAISLVIAFVLYLFSWYVTETHIRELKESVQKQENFMGNFTHEIKTPMTSIIGYADMLRTYDLEPEKRREYSGYIYTEAKRIDQLSANLLQLIVLNKTEFPMEKISVKSLFAQLKKEVYFLGEKYQTEILFELEERTIWGEKSLLIMAIKNLVDNACKASRTGEKVLVKGRCAGEHYAIQVVDNGYGIPMEDIKHVSEPFYMVDKSRTRKQGGAGLGLSLCSRIVEVHDGKMQIDSQKGKGTTVTLYLKYEAKGGN